MDARHEAGHDDNQNLKAFNGFPQFRSFRRGRRRHPRPIPATDLEILGHRAVGRVHLCRDVCRPDRRGLWIAIRVSRTPFTDYLALRWTSWSNLLIGIGALFVLVMGWDLLSRATGREVAPGFMTDVLKSASADGALWLLVLAFCVAAPISEELFARGFLYRGWSQSFLGVPGAILLSSLVWTSLHLQYDWFFFGEVFSIGLLLGYLRYRCQSTWLTIVVHGLNNLAATLQSMWLAGTS